MARRIGAEQALTLHRHSLFSEPCLRFAVGRPALAWQIAAPRPV